MNNERIDLTQFEGIKEWKVIPYHHDKVIDWQVKTGRNMRSKEEAETIAKLPTLIAELKRCYEELDEANEVGEALWNVLENWDICMDDYSMHDLYNNLDEKYARNDEGRIILKELYSYTEEDGWQPKEQASK